ncbi:MAG: iron-sulfur cluster assembly scaffold protein [Planctomycetota bacterium]
MNMEKYKALNANPTHLGIMETYDGLGTLKVEGCGDNYEIYLKIKDGKIHDAKFKTTGCGFGLAALELTLREAIGKTLDEAENIPKEQVEKGIEGFPPARAHYLTEAQLTLRNALQDARQKLASPSR